MKRHLGRAGVIAAHLPGTQRGSAHHLLIGVGHQHAPQCGRPLASPRLGHGLNAARHATRAKGRAKLIGEGFAMQT